MKQYCGEFMMKRFEKITLLILAMATMHAGAAVEATTVSTNEVSSTQALMLKLDVNKDGQISLKEAVRHTELLRNFGLIDDNEDGKLTESELAKSELTPKNTSQIAGN